jgi:hypothetical protein
METVAEWKYLARKPKSTYKQLFVKDRWVAARTLYGQSVGEGARTPCQLAADYRLPLEAVHEAIAYCESNPKEVQEDWQREQTMEETVSLNAPVSVLSTDASTVSVAPGAE